MAKKFIHPNDKSDFEEAFALALEKRIALANLKILFKSYVAKRLHQQKINKLIKMIKSKNAELTKKNAQIKEMEDKLASLKAKMDKMRTTTPQEQLEDFTNGKDSSNM